MISFHSASIKLKEIATVFFKQGLCQLVPDFLCIFYLNDLYLIFLFKCLTSSTENLGRCDYHATHLSIVLQLSEILIQSSRLNFSPKFYMLAPGTGGCLNKLYSILLSSEVLSLNYETTFFDSSTFAPIVSSL